MPEAALEPAPRAANKQPWTGPEASPYWAHDLQLALVDLLPTALAVKIVSDMHHAIRKKGMKKEAEKAKAK